MKRRAFIAAASAFLATPVLAMFNGPYEPQPIVAADYNKEKTPMARAIMRQEEYDGEFDEECLTCTTDALIHAYQILPNRVDGTIIVKIQTVEPLVVNHCSHSSYTDITIIDIKTNKMYVIDNTFLNVMNTIKNNFYEYTFVYGTSMHVRDGIVV
jgi:hypothetical protein